MAEQRISISKAKSVAEVKTAIAALKFESFNAIDGDLVKGRVSFGRSRAFPTETANGTKGVYRLNTNLVHDMAGFKTEVKQFKATVFPTVIDCQKAWYELQEKFICRANVWDDNPDLNKLRLGGDFEGRIRFEKFEKTLKDGSKVPATAWTVNDLISAGIKTAPTTTFTLEDDAPSDVVPPVTPPVVGLDPNQVRVYNGVNKTVAELRSANWTDAQIEQHAPVATPSFDAPPF